MKKMTATKALTLLKVWAKTVGLPGLSDFIKEIKIDSGKAMVIVDIPFVGRHNIVLSNEGVDAATLLSKFQLTTVENSKDLVNPKEA